MTQKKHDFKWGPGQQQAFDQIKQEIVHAVALGLTRTGHVVLKLNFTLLGNLISKIMGKGRVCLEVQEFEMGEKEIIVEN